MNDEPLTKAEWEDIAMAVRCQVGAQSGSVDVHYWYELAERICRLHLPNESETTNAT